MWDWELIKSGSSQGRYEVLVQYTHEDFHYAHAISYDTEQNEYCLHNHALYELVYCVRGDVICQEVDEPIQAHVDAKRAAQASAQPAAQPAAACSGCFA